MELRETIGRMADVAGSLRTSLELRFLFSAQRLLSTFTKFTMFTGVARFCAYGLAIGASLGAAYLAIRDRSAQLTAWIFRLRRIQICSVVEGQSVGLLPGLTVEILDVTGVSS